MYSPSHILSISFRVCCLLASVLFHQGCRSSAGGMERTEQKDTLVHPAPSEAQKPSGTQTENGADTYVICQPGADVFDSETGGGTIAFSAEAGYSLSFLEEVPYEIVPDKRYLVEIWQQGRKAIKGWVDGRNIATAIRADLDGDGRPDAWIGAHYLTYDTSDAGGFDNQAEVLLMKDGWIAQRINLEAYSHFSWTRYRGTGLQGLQECWQLQYGLEACDHPLSEYLYYWNGKELALLNNYHRSGGEFGGVNHQFIFPADSGGRAEEIVVVESEHQLKEGGDQMNEKDWDEHSTLERWKWESGRFVKVE